MFGMVIVFSTILVDIWKTQVAFFVKTQWDTKKLYLKIDASCWNDMINTLECPDKDFFQIFVAFSIS